MKYYFLVALLFILGILASCSDDSEAPTLPSLRIWINNQEVDSYRCDPGDTIKFKAEIRYDPTLHPNNASRLYIYEYWGYKDMPPYWTEGSILFRDENFHDWDVTMQLSDTLSRDLQYTIEYVNQDEEVEIRKTVYLLVE